MFGQKNQNKTMWAQQRLLAYICAVASIFCADGGSHTRPPAGRISCKMRGVLLVKNRKRSSSPQRRASTILHPRHSRLAPAFASTGICSLVPSGGTKKSTLRSYLASSSSDQNEKSESSFNNALSTTTKRKRTISPDIDYFTKQQLSNIFGTGGSSEWSKFVPLSLAGRWSQNSEENPPTGTVETVFLSSPEQCERFADAYEQYLKSKDDSSSMCDQSTSLPIPISTSMSTNAIKLLSQTYSNTPLSKSVLLSLNSLLVNRDGGLFDNLPWSTWSIDPNLTERDAANNVMEAKFTMGKRVAYQRFMGKDWQGRSLSLGNLANRIIYMLEQSDEADADNASDSISDGMGGPKEQDAMLSLSERLLQLEIKEARMNVAECEQRLAMSKIRIEDGDNIDEKEATNQLEAARERLCEAETSLQELRAVIQSATAEEDYSFFKKAFAWNNDDKNSDSTKKKIRKTKSLLISILDKMTEQKSPPPYRGAIGYPAMLDTKKEMFEDSVLPYSSPYELLLDIVGEQLNSEVMGCVLEPTSLLKGNLVLGGALLLKRKGVRKSTTLSGEIVSYTDDDDALGNEGVLPRSMYVVECFSDEAIGMALASEKPLFVEEELCNRAGSVPVKLDVRKAALVKSENESESKCIENLESLSFTNRVPPIRPLDESFSSQSEGERVQSEEESNLVRIPLTTSPQLFDGPNQAPQSSSSQRSVFSTFNPVKTLDEYDELTDDDKARLLIKLESFNGILPRPRAVRTSKAAATSEYESGTPPSLLDDIILPLVDESIRRQYRIRDAERRGDTKEVQALRNEVSPRQSILESAQNAREEGLDDEADRLEEEARLYAALRADVTQDEGAYSRFLDRDDWYERETQARIKRLDKSKFGTLLDGVD